MGDVNKFVISTPLTMIIILILLTKTSGLSKNVWFIIQKKFHSDFVIIDPRRLFILLLRVGISIPSNNIMERFWS